MAFRKRCRDEPQQAHLPVRTVSLQGCYHGDTLGAMDCAPRSEYNNRQTRWYEDRCFAFDPPTAGIVGGVWTLMPPSGDGGAGPDVREATFRDRDAIFSTSRAGSEYDSFLTTTLEDELGRGEFDFGALMMEPLMLAAGGMRLVDPAFQRSLVRCCRELGIPIVFDEVFTGIWRLGAISGADLLGVSPDIASYGKLLTGGTVPLAATLAKEEVFNAFLGDSKRDALLHGHSYTAHAIGCAAAVEALSSYNNASKGFGPDGNAFPGFWDEGVAREISCIPGVRSTTVMGTVLATELEVEDERGYSSTVGNDVTSALFARGIFARPLGNVVYLLCTPLTTAEERKSVCAVFMDVLQAELGEQPRITSGIPDR
jgi:bifunctional dethiobiotin synthetase / adenosylmethionine---8-amino-7-oxononanoate aminotransferase